MDVHCTVIGIIKNSIETVVIFNLTIVNVQIGF